MAMLDEGNWVLLFIGTLFLRTNPLMG